MSAPESNHGDEFEGEPDGGPNFESEAVPGGSGASASASVGEGESAESLSVPEDVLCLGDVEWAEFDADALVEVAKLSQRLLGQVQAVQLKAVAELRARRGCERETADEVGLALAVGQHQADRQIELATQVTCRFPRLLGSLERGDVDAYKAAKVVEAGALLSDEHADQLDAAMEPLLDGRDGAAIQRSARYRVDKLDPEGAAERVRRCREDRRVELRFTENGMADLCAYLPAETAAAIYGRIDAIAKSNKTRRDERSLDAIRADVFTELLLGTRQSYRRVQIQVTVPVTTLLGVRDLPGDLEGYGPIPAEIAREMAADPTCTWRRLLTDPPTGQLLEMGRRRYKPPAQLGDYVRARDRRCLVPGCNRPARRCDTDHSIEWHRHGTTDAKLLACLCRRHHRLKDRPGWHFEFNGDTLTITTPTGRTYRPRTPRIAEPEPPPDVEPAPPSDPEPPPF
ncbi:HNH endonuclease signature motif containing protein [Haloechinothrix halophila]|uniref:HNH endonuclease signature motif containing protein n=1 Tax=Haloechinothrix halophila TaxID=1069073 RepID=UPI00040089FE|nr:HNH endonuclease signature motif containing protein [Haloechinothrix halophila]